MLIVRPLSILLFGSLVWSPEALAQSVYRWGVPNMAYPVPLLDSAGCYYYRGRQWCGRYCYYEVNGRRYCQRRQREAVPQAGYGYFWDGPVQLK